MHAFNTNTSYLASQSPYFTLLLLFLLQDACNAPHSNPLQTSFFSHTTILKYEYLYISIVTSTNA